MQRSAEPAPSFVRANAFAALDTKKKTKKKSDKEKDAKAKKPAAKAPAHSNGLATPAFGEPPKFASTNWADESDDDDFAMAPMANWVQVRPLEHASDSQAAAGCSDR